MGDADAEVVCPVWTTKTPKAAQPNLNYIGILRFKIFIFHQLRTDQLTPAAPEVQHKGSCATYSDLYSLGMVFIACFNGGHSVIQASHSSSNFFKLAGQVCLGQPGTAWCRGDHRFIISVV